jgi:hypothetical protein
VIGPCTDPRCIKVGVELGFVSSSTLLPCPLLTPKSLSKNSVHVDRWSKRLRTVDVQKRISYLRRRFGGWRKRRRNENRRRRRTVDRRRMRGRGGLRQQKRSTHDRRNWKGQDRKKGRLWSQRIMEKRWRKSRKAQKKK